MVVHASRRVFMMGWTRFTVSGLYTGRVFVIIEAGVIASAFGQNQ